MTKINIINTRFTYIFTVLTAIILLYECFHIRQGIIIKVVGFIVVTIFILSLRQKNKTRNRKMYKRDFLFTKETGKMDNL